MNQDVTNAFYLASNYHDWLAKPPISFTPAAGSSTPRAATRCC